MAVMIEIRGESVSCEWEVWDEGESTIGHCDQPSTCGFAFFFSFSCLELELQVPSSFVGRKHDVCDDKIRDETAWSADSRRNPPILQHPA